MVRKKDLRSAVGEALGSIDGESRLPGSNVAREQVTVILHYRSVPDRVKLVVDA